MIPNDHAIMMYKFGERRWIQKILDGELSFSSPAAFIHQAKISGNYVQGDLKEAVFARLLNSDCRIEEMINKLGSNLEIIPDGDYSFLRRKSAKFKPIFCMFAYTAGDALCNSDISKIGKQKLRLEFDKRMFEGFSQNITLNVIAETHMFTILFLQSKPFIDNVKMALKFVNIPYQMKKVKYIDMTNGEFFIEPTDSYNELFYKSVHYEYQHEARICLSGEKFTNIFERYPLRILQVLKDDYVMCNSEIYVEFIATIENVEDEWEGGE